MLIILIIVLDNGYWFIVIWEWGGSMNYVYNVFILYEEIC